MTDSEKVYTIKEVLREAWKHWPDGDSGYYWRGIAVAVEAIANAKNKTNKEEMLK